MNNAGSLASSGSSSNSSSSDSHAIAVAAVVLACVAIACALVLAVIVAKITNSGPGFDCVQQSKGSFQRLEDCKNTAYNNPTNNPSKDLPGFLY
jgi:preprotein translocase subunit SecG